MLDILTDIDRWTEEKKPFALATVIRTWGSSPRPVGSALAVTGEMEMAGSVSGGCVEGTVVRDIQEVIESGRPRRMKFGVTDEEAWAVGLSCGGAIHVWAERFPSFDSDPAEQAAGERLREALRNNEGCVLLSAMDESGAAHLLLFPDGSSYGKLREEESLKEAAFEVYRQRSSQTVEHEGREYFARVFPRKSQLLIVGAAHITADLVQLGNFFGFETVVIDPRGIFTQKTQFASPPQRMLEEWPAEVLSDFTLDEYTYAVMLTHDPKIDDQALHLLLKSDIGYIGALGSRRTHAKRVKRLTEAGFSEAEIARIHAPIGVDINAKRPKEIALSILAELIKVQNQYR